MAPIIKGGKKMADKKNVWDKLANKYNRLWVQKYSLTPTRNRVKQILSDHFHADEFTLLDLGCGTGQLLSELRENNPNCRLIGVDKSSEMIRQANRQKNNIEFSCLDADNDDLLERFPAGSFNTVICCHSFPYYKNKATVLNTLYKLLNSGGIAVFVQASVNSVYDKIALRVVEATAEKAEYLSRKAFRLLVAEHFEITEEFTVREKFYMPSICGFVMRKRP